MSNQILSMAQTELSIRPLKAIDLSLEALGYPETQRNPDLSKTFLNLLFEAISKSQNIDPPITPGDSMSSLFREETSEQTQRFAAVCLLRLLSVKHTYFDDQTLRIPALRLFDAVLADDIYRHLHINPTDQSYEKFSKLRDLARSIENEISEVIRSLTRLENLASFRASLMQKLNADLSKAILRPFLSKELLDFRLNDVFQALLLRPLNS